MKTRLLLAMLVLGLMSALIASVVAEEEGTSDFVQVEIPPWEQRHQFKVRFEIKEVGKQVMKPKITVNSGMEAIISIGSQALIGNKEEIDKHLIGHQVAVAVEEFTEDKYQLKFNITINSLTRLDKQRVSVDKGIYNGGHIVEVGTEYILVDLSTEETPGLKITCMLEEALPVNWVNVAPVTVVAEDVPLDKVFQIISEQAEIEIIQKDDSSFEGDIPVVSAFFAEVSCEKAMQALGDFCGFTVRFERESNTCIINP